MREIRYTGQFKRDYKREKSSRYGKRIDDLLEEAVIPLMENRPLPQHFVDHALNGQWRDYRDCHIRPDLILIYRKPDAETLDLVRLVHIASWGCDIIIAHILIK